MARSFDAVELTQHRVVPSQSEHALTLLGYDDFPEEQTLVIVDPTSMQTCERGQVGEIWLSGPCVAKGYWRHFAQTEQTFHAYLADTQTGPFMRTGDLGFLHEDALFITGRLKDVIILQGRNYYPQDIELTVERCHPAIRPNACAAFAINESGEEQLAVLVEIDPHYHPGKEHSNSESIGGGTKRPLDGDKLVRTIRLALSEEQNVHAQRIVLLKAGSVLKTSSGKLQRRASRASFLRGELTLWGE
jgi:acyl-CoA synthetase (AMP-forming)/AMP-acid ligase II